LFLVGPQVELGMRIPAVWVVWGMVLHYLSAELVVVGDDLLPIVELASCSWSFANSVTVVGSAGKPHFTIPFKESLCAHVHYYYKNR
jgi:hypothetical protein